MRVDRKVRETQLSRSFHIVLFYYGLRIVCFLALIIQQRMKKLENYFFIFFLKFVLLNP